MLLFRGIGGATASEPICTRRSTGLETLWISPQVIVRITPIHLGLHLRPPDAVGSRSATIPLTLIHHTRLIPKSLEAVQAPVLQPQSLSHLRTPRIIGRGEREYPG